MVDMAIDQNNPLGIDFRKMNPLEYYIRIKRKGISNVLCKCVCVKGKVKKLNTK
jgi:hypothetical protein